MAMAPACYYPASSCNAMAATSPICHSEAKLGKLAPTSTSSLQPKRLNVSFPIRYSSSQKVSATETDLTTTPITTVTLSSSSSSSFSDGPAPSSADITTTADEETDWVLAVPLVSFPKSERHVFKHNSSNVILLWHQDEVFALENKCPLAPRDPDGFLKADVNEEGCIVCPFSQSTFDLKTGAVRDWLPNSSYFERLWTPPLNELVVYPVKIDADCVYVNKKPWSEAVIASERLDVPPDDSVFAKESGEFSGLTWEDFRIWFGLGKSSLLWEDLDSIVFGFTPENELINGRAAMVGFLGLLMFECMSGEGFLKGFGVLDVLYQYLPGFPVLKY